MSSHEVLLSAGRGGVCPMSMFKGYNRGRHQGHLMAELPVEDVLAESICPCSAITSLIRGGGYSQEA